MFCTSTHLIVNSTVCLLYCFHGFFFCNGAATPEIYTLSLHDALPISRRQVAIQNRVASNIGISQSTFSVKVLNLFSRSRRKTNKRKSKHSAMLRNKETRHRMFIGL